MMKQWMVGFVAACGMAAAVQAAAPSASGAPATAQPRPTGGNFTAPPPDRVPVCTRATLQAAVDSYVEAQRTGNPRKLALSGNVRVLQDMAPIEPAQGLWNKPLAIAATNSILDATRCKTFTEIVVTEGTPYVIGTRLYVDEGRITRIDSLVTTKGDWLFNANNYAHVMKMEDWNVLPAARRTKAQEMINGANGNWMPSRTSTSISPGVRPASAPRAARTPTPRVIRIPPARWAFRMACCTS